MKIGMMRSFIGLVVCIFTSQVWAAMPLSQPVVQNLTHEQLKFVYQELNSPWPSFACKHEEDGPFDWKVYCKLDNKVAEFGVHLLINRYAKTRFGQGAYEVLYWVTDRTSPKVRVYDSTTLWIHNSTNDNNVNQFNLNQGIVNDMAALQLTITF